jgi:hypothetical protein
MKPFVLSSCTVAALIVVAGVANVRGAEFGYEFVPSSTSDGSLLSAWGGELYLDASSSSGGGVSDILSGSWLKTPDGTFLLSASSIGPLIGPPNNPTTPFTWNAGEITSMDLYGHVTLPAVDGSDYFWQITASDINIQAPDPAGVTAYGSWVAGYASVPDSASTALLFALAAAGLCGLEYSNRSRRLAMARV